MYLHLRTGPNPQRGLHPIPNSVPRTEPYPHYSAPGSGLFIPTCRGQDPYPHYPANDDEETEPDPYPHYPANDDEDKKTHCAFSIDVNIKSNRKRVSLQRHSMTAPWWFPSEAVLVERDRALHTFRGASLALSLSPPFSLLVFGPPDSRPKVPSSECMGTLLAAGVRHE